MHDESGTVCRYVSLFSDITALKEHQQRLEHIAHSDAHIDPRFQSLRKNLSVRGCLHRLPRRDIPERRRTSEGHRSNQKSDTDE